MSHQARSPALFSESIQRPPYAVMALANGVIHALESELCRSMAQKYKVLNTVDYHKEADPGDEALRSSGLRQQIQAIPRLRENPKTPLAKRRDPDLPNG